MLRSMESFRIGFYGMAQVAAIVYGVLASGTVLKVTHPWPNPDEPTAPAPDFNPGMFYRDHGLFLLVLVIAWAAGSAYLSSERSRYQVNEEEIAKSGMGLTIAYALLGTLCAFLAAMPQHVLQHIPVANP